MIAAWVRWLRGCTVGALLAPGIVCACFIARFTKGPTPKISLLLLFATALIAPIMYRLLTFKRLHSWLEPLCEEQTSVADKIPLRLVPLCIAAAAGVSLLLELSIIRWQAGLFEFFSFYKNFGMLSCFAGLGIGYVLSTRRQIALICTLPLLVLQLALLTFLSQGFFPCNYILRSLPVQEQLSVGTGLTRGWPDYVAIYYTLTLVILLTVLALVPIGQICGKMMSRIQSVKAYGANLLGSLAGIILMTGLSALSTPPVIWFAIVFFACIAASLYDRRAAAVSMTATLLGVIVLSWPVEFGSERVYSPYQLLERGLGDHGWTMLRAGCFYYQRVLDLSKAAREAFKDPLLEARGRYYDLPYTFKSAPDSVLIFGAGMGNDVAAALRNGAKHVDAVEIDPCIAEWGKIYHPEHCYSDPKVTLIVDDARAFLRRSPSRYDMVVFGLIDAHTVTGHASSLRIDSYIYTQESLKEARAHLNDGGLLSLSFVADKGGLDALEAKIYRMMTNAFDGHPPQCIKTDYDGSISFFQNKEGSLAKPTVLYPTFYDPGSNLARMKMDVDCSTDDWPFFYMPRRIWPLSYLPMLAILALIALLVSRSFGTIGKGTPAKNLQFFLLGSGFMLVEAKAITELGLNFGNTWSVTATVIAAVVFLGFIGNLLVEHKVIKNLFVSYILVLLTVALGLCLAMQGGLPSTSWGKLITIMVLVGPVAFSGVSFSLLISDEPDVSNAMCWNLLGAMLGGTLEYTAMYTGYRALYIIVLVIYAAAFVAFLLLRFNVVGSIGQTVGAGHSESEAGSERSS
ncbi:MAG TPA: hypothetical protein V6C69_08125 [Trichormus sp.]|jgi:hypothetical protein